MNAPLRVGRHGFLVLDKPIGITSAKAVAMVKRTLGCDKIGHGGTLDPLASGVLPLAIGEATKAFDYVASSRKTYEFTVTFGQERTTGDAEGEVSASTDARPSLQTLQECLGGFTGRITQIPPAYSALKVDGKRAYALARAGQEVQLAPREIEVYGLEYLSHQGPEDALSAATLRAECGKGTYIRVLGLDIARKINSMGYISVLRRTRVGKFSAEGAISLENLPSLVHNTALLGAWVGLELALDDIPAIIVSPEQARKLRQGQALPASQHEGTLIALCEGRAVALLAAEPGRLRPRRVFNLSDGD